MMMTTTMMLVMSCCHDYIQLQMRWDGVTWNGMGWDGIEWNGIFVGRLVGSELRMRLFF